MAKLGSGWPYPSSWVRVTLGLPRLTIPYRHSSTVDQSDSLLFERVERLVDHRLLQVARFCLPSRVVVLIGNRLAKGVAMAKPPHHILLKWMVVHELSYSLSYSWWMLILRVCWWLMLLQNFMAYPLLSIDEPWLIDGFLVMAQVNQAVVVLCLIS